MHSQYKKNILILGGSSFVGTNLLEKFSKYSTKYNITYTYLKKDCQIKLKNIKKFKLDLTKLKNVKKFLKDKKFDFIINCVSNNQNYFSTKENDLIIFKENVYPLINLIKSITQLHIGSEIIQFSSKDKIKKNSSSYPLSKKIVEKICNLITKKKLIKIRLLKLTRVFGKYDTSNNRIIPFLVEKNLKKKKYLLRNKSLTYIFTDDLFSIIEKIIYKKKFKLNEFIKKISIKKLDYLLKKTINKSDNTKKKIVEKKLYKIFRWYIANYLK